MTLTHAGGWPTFWARTPGGRHLFVGDGSSTFPNCIQHQVANLTGTLNGTSGGVPVLWGAASEGPSYAATAGTLPGMNLCPADGVRLPGQCAVLQHYRAGHRSDFNFVSDVVVAAGGPAGGPMVNDARQRPALPSDPGARSSTPCDLSPQP